MSNSIGIMTRTDSLRVDNAINRSKKAEEAADRLNGGYDPYSKKASGAVAGLEAEVQIAEHTRDLERVNILKTEQQTVDQTIDEIHQLNTTAHTYLVSLRQVNDITKSQMDKEIAGFRDQLVSLLNRKFQGRAIFGGDNSKDDSVNAAVINTGLLSTAPVDTTYYTGGKNDAFIKIGAQDIQRYPVTAEHEAFSHTIAALRYMTDATSQPNANNAQLVKAIETLEVASVNYKGAIKDSARITQKYNQESEAINTRISQKEDVFQSVMGSDAQRDLAEHIQGIKLARMQLNIVLSAINSLDELTRSH